MQIMSKFRMYLIHEGDICRERAAHVQAIPKKHERKIGARLKLIAEIIEFVEILYKRIKSRDPDLYYCNRGCALNFHKLTR